jgi:hypothetical protein
VESEAPRRSPFAVPLAVLAIVLYFISVVGHAMAGGWFAALFGWGRQHGVSIEKWLFGIMLAIATAFVVTLLVKIARGPRSVLGELALRIAAWALFVASLERYTLYIQSELMHFIQYGGMALLLTPLLGPRGAFLVATLGGVIDETHQFIAYRGAGDDPDNYMDWPDCLLNIGGASGGALPALALGLIARETRGDAEKEPPGAPLAFGVAALAALFVIVAPAIFLGHYPHDFWREYPDNHKPHHVLPTIEGVPAIAAAVIFWLCLLDPRRRSFPIAALVAMAALAHIAIRPVGTQGPLPEPDGAVPTVTAARATGPIKIDGVLDEPDWARAQRVEIVDACDPLVRERWEKKGRKPATTSHARVLWDDQNLYVAFEVEDEDIWARDVPRDTTTLPGDEVIELFVDADAAGQTYYEVEVSPKNVVYDLLVQRPPPPAWRPVPSGFVGHEGWDWRGLQSAVKVEGPLEVLPPEGNASMTRTLGPSKSWVAELAMPFAALKGRRIPPVAGDRWRINFNRVARQRPVSQEDYMFPELQSWAPLGSADCEGYVSFHRPWRFGWIVFGDSKATQ